MANRSGLPGVTASSYVDEDVQLALVLRQDERLLHDGLQGLQTEVLIESSLVDRDLSAARHDINSGYRTLPSARAVISVSRHLDIPLK